MRALALALVSLLAIYSVNCEVYFEEKFPDGKVYQYREYLVKSAGTPRVLLI